jgi:hypothetical protein
MRSSGIGDRLLTGGGIIPPDDMATLAKQGVGRLFGPGASTQDIAEYIREWFAGSHSGNGSATANTRGSSAKKPAARAGGRAASARSTAKRTSSTPARTGQARSGRAAGDRRTAAPEACRRTQAPLTAHPTQSARAAPAVQRREPCEPWSP